MRLCNWFGGAVPVARPTVGAAQPLADDRFTLVLQEFERRLSIARPVELLIADQVRVPVVVGVHWPRILLPAACVDWPVEKIRIVLSHDWQRGAAGMSSADWPPDWLRWCIGFIRWSGWRCDGCEAGERACDDRVLAAGVQPVEMRPDWSRWPPHWPAGRRG